MKPCADHDLKVRFIESCHFPIWLLGHCVDSHADHLPLNLVGKCCSANPCSVQMRSCCSALFVHFQILPNDAVNLSRRTGLFGNIRYLCGGPLPQCSATDKLNLYKESACDRNCCQYCLLRATVCCLRPFDTADEPLNSRNCRLPPRIFL